MPPSPLNLSPSLPDKKLLPALENAINAEARDRFNALIEGVDRYARLPQQPRPQPGGSAIWAQGAVTLFDYGSAGGHTEPLLAIPSLINRSYILDLEPRHSFMRFLSREAGHAYLLDWGEPEQEKTPLTMEQYITERFEPALDLLYAKQGRPVALVGYCMGGLLAMAAAIRQPHKVGKLVLLATPWDFYAEGMAPASAFATPIAEALGQPGIVPKELIHAWFYLQKPWAVHDKFARFGRYAENSPKLREFLRIEHWLQDGVGMSTGAAQACFIHWAAENRTGLGKWQVMGETVDPARIKAPVFIAIPESDTIVSPASTAPLLKAMPHAHTHRIRAGHISMVAGQKARQNLWVPLANWLLTKS